jgi:hypothetical protein
MKMTKQSAKSTVMVMAVLLGVVVAAHADPGPARFSVPFEFVVGAEVLPAGEYLVSSLASGRVLVRSADGRVTTAFTLVAKAREASAESKLVFHRYGDRHFLAQVWTQGATLGRELPASSAELEARKQSEAKLAVVAAKSK